MKRKEPTLPTGFATREDASAALGIPVGKVDAMIEQSQAGNTERPVFARIGGKLQQVAGRPLSMEKRG